MSSTRKLGSGEGSSDSTKRETVFARNASRVRSILWTLGRSKEAIIGTIVVALYVGTAIVVWVCGILHLQITPYGPLEQYSGPAFAPPSWSHPFGTDMLGYDLFSRVISATPNDVSVGLIVVGLGFLAGIIIGSVAAFKGGLMDELLMRFTDVVFALPVLVIAMAVVAAIGPGLTNMMIVLTAIWWPPYARLARGEALKVSHQNYVEAARLSGNGTWKIVLRHVLPNIFVTLLVYATLDIGTVILVYAGLSYLGLSVRPPNPDWGEMVSSYQDNLITAPWLPIIPGLIIAIGVVGFSLLGDGMRDTLEAR